MPLQNRVDPFGQLRAVAARGAWMGNRGLLHDADRGIRRPFRLRAWLICVLVFKDRHRVVMSPGLYTELFFLDEATALSAGHRPCAECRREAHRRFRAAVEAGSERRFAKVADLDAALHADRWDPTTGQRLWRAPMSDLPDGVFVRREGEAWLVRGGRLHRWTPIGYAESLPAPHGDIDVLTPRLTVQAIRAGYVPQMALAGV